MDNQKLKVENTVGHHLAAMVALSPKGEVGAVLQEICHNLTECDGIRSCFRYRFRY